MDFNEELKKESAGWVDTGLLSHEQREQILALYPGTKRSYAAQLLAIVAALLVGTGIISLISWNWDFIDRFPRLLIAFLPLIITQFLVIRAWKNHSLVFKETSLVLNSLAALTCLALTSQIYQIQGSAFWLLIIASALTLPIALLFRSLAAGTLAGFLIILAGFFSSWKEPWAAMSLVALAALPLLSWLRKHFDNKSSETSWWVVAAGLPILLSIQSAEYLQGGLIIVQLGLVGTFMALTRGWVGRPFTVGAVVLHIITGATMGFQVFWQYGAVTAWQEMSKTLEKVPLLWIITVVLAIMAGLVISIGRAVKKRSFPALEFTGLASFFLWLLGPVLSGNGVNSLIPTLASNLVAGAWGLHLMLKHEGRQKEVIGGALILVGILNQRFFDSDFSLLVKGTVFIVSGLALWGLWHLRFNKKVQKHGEDQS